MRTKLATGAFAALALFALASAAAAAKLTIAVGGAGCLCYLPTVLAQQLGEYKKAGVDIELVEFQGRLAGADRGDRRQRRRGVGILRPLRQFGRQEPAAHRLRRLRPLSRPGARVSPRHTNEISSVKDLAGKKVGVSAPGSSTDFFLKYLLAKNGVDPNSVAVIGIGLDATAVAAMEQAPSMPR